MNVVSSALMQCCREIWAYFVAALTQAVSKESLKSYQRFHSIHSIPLQDSHIEQNKLSEIDAHASGWWYQRIMCVTRSFDANAPIHIRRLAQEHNSSFY